MGSAVTHGCCSCGLGGRGHDDRRGGRGPHSPQSGPAQKAPPPEQRPQEQHPQQQRPGGRARPAPLVALDDVAALEAQVARLRSSIDRRRNVAGCSNKSDNVSEIVSHYEEILEKTERQLRELSTQQAKAKPPASPTHSRADPESTTCSSASTQQQGRCWSNVSTTLLAFDA